MFRNTTLCLAVAAASAGLVACGGGDDAPADPPLAQVGNTIALTASGRLISFDRAAPNQQVGSVAVTGLASGESLLGIDVRPADGRLHGVGDRGNVYTIEPSTGVATLKAALRAAAGDDNPFAALAGANFGVDFNPAADRLRVVSDTGQNLRINVDTGDTITDGTIAPLAGAASVTAAAYTNSFAGTTTTQLFDIDSTTGLLHLQDPPNNGTLAAGLALGVAGTAVNGFDIDARSNTGYAALSVAGANTLYSVNLTSGAATSVGVIAGAEAIKGLALMQSSAPAVIALTTDNRLVSFDPSAPNTLTATVSITGLAAGENVLGIDFRPADGRLIALTSAARLYEVNTGNGAATLKSTLAADTSDPTAPFVGLSGSVFSVDFNPAVDRLRVVSESGQNLRINVDTGATTTDGDINRVFSASVLASAYSNSFAGATSTALFNLEANSDVLTQQAPPNDGTLANLGSLGLDIGAMAGFDIAGGANGLVLAALGSGAGGPFSLYTVSLATGAATLYRNAGGNVSLSLIGGASGPALRDIAIRL